MQAVEQLPVVRICLAMGSLAAGQGCMLCLLELDAIVLAVEEEEHASC